MTIDHLGILPEQPDRRLLRRAATLGRTEPLWAEGPRILSDPVEIATLLRNGSLTKDFPRSLAHERTENSPALRQIVDNALFLLDPPEHGQLRAALNPLHADPDQMNTRIRASLMTTLDSLPLGVPLDARADVGVPAAAGVVAAMFNITIPADEADHLARTAMALNGIASVHTGNSQTEHQEPSARALGRAADRWLSTPSFTVGSDPTRSRAAAASAIPSDRYHSLIQFVAATALETVATTVVAGLASALPLEQDQRLLTHATTAPLLPYRLKQTRHNHLPVLLNISHTHPFGVGRHHCLGANIAKLVAQTTLGWATERRANANGELQWQTDKLGRSLHGTITLRRR
jgi:cytochrome P450